MTAPAPDLVLYEKDGPLAWLTLNRPHAHNAVNLEMRDLLWSYLDAIEFDPEVRVVVLQGAGPHAFSAGADIKEFGTAPSYLQARDARLNRDLWGRMTASQKPFIAAIHGWALGAGCEMSLHCDLRIASEDASFGLPEVNLGYIPSAGGTQTLPRQIPRAVALEMIMTAAPIDAARALQLGLVQWVVPNEELQTQARAIAMRLAELPPSALRAAREALRIAADEPLAAGMRLSARLAQRLLRTTDRERALAGMAPQV